MPAYLHWALTQTELPSSLCERWLWVLLAALVGLGFLVGILLMVLRAVTR